MQTYIFDFIIVIYLILSMYQWKQYKLNPDTVLNTIILFFLFYTRYIINLNIDASGTIAISIGIIVILWKILDLRHQRIKYCKETELCGNLSEEQIKSLKIVHNRNTLIDLESNLKNLNMFEEYLSEDFLERKKLYEEACEQQFEILDNQIEKSQTNTLGRYRFEKKLINDTDKIIEKLFNKAH